MKKKTMMELDNYIKSCTNYDDLTATNMAYDCNVSQATISRYVQLMGYDNFNHLRYSLVEKNLIEKNLEKTNNPILNKINYINYCLSEFKKFDFEQLKLLNAETILVYCEPRFELITRIFIEKMNLIQNNYCNVRSISEFKYVLNSSEGECTVLSIGDLPEEFYEKELKYLVIKYKKENELKRNNIHEINILNKRQGRKENKLNDNLLALMITLEIISEVVIKNVKSEKELENMKKYLI